MILGAGISGKVLFTVSTYPLRSAFESLHRPDNSAHHGQSDTSNTTFSCGSRACSHDQLYGQAVELFNGASPRYETYLTC
jgi:hypothetical protein